MMYHFDLPFECFQFCRHSSTVCTAASCIFLSYTCPVTSLAKCNLRLRGYLMFNNFKTRVLPLKGTRPSSQGWQVHFKSKFVIFSQHDSRTRGPSPKPVKVLYGGTPRVYNTLRFKSWGHRGWQMPFIWQRRNFCLPAGQTGKNCLWAT